MFERLIPFNKKRNSEKEEVKINDAYGEELMRYSEASKKLAEAEERIVFLESSKTNDSISDLEIDDEIKLLNQLCDKLTEKINNSPLKDLEELKTINADIQNVLEELNKNTILFYELNAELNNREKKFLNIKLSPDQQEADKASYTKLEEDVSLMRQIRKSQEDTLEELRAKHTAIENKIKQDCLAIKEAKLKSEKIAA